jgi:hypothetical protein
MPANNDYPSYNGITPSWADVIIRITPDGAPLVEARQVKAINTNVSLEVGEQRAGGRVMKFTAGSSSNEGSLTLYRGGWQDMLTALVDLAPKRGDLYILRYVRFNVNYIYTPVGDTAIYERRLKGCFVSGAAMNGAEGTDAAEVEVPLKVTEITDVINGKEVVLL